MVGKNQNNNFVVSNNTFMSPEINLANIFTPLKKGDRSKLKLDKTKVFNNVEMKFTCFEPLSVDDHKLFISILNFCSDRSVGIEIDNSSSNEIALILKNEIFSEKNIGETSVEDSLVYMSCFKSDIMNATGYSGGKNYIYFDIIIERLSSVNIIVKELVTKKKYNMQLLSFYEDVKTGKICIAINTKSANAILGGQYSHINQADYLSLEDNIEKLMYTYLCSYVPQRNGKGKKSYYERKSKIVSLLEKFYPDINHLSRNTLNSYCRKTIALLNKINKFEKWNVQIKGKGANALVIFNRE
ncbi:hypothetical protein GCM10023116_29760 [Kistimonas scapharcae]|uniref:Uncharacterized protein n=1 Tax=Kistimonas scapharcae TaxID=1036133 RepID=A0ABP8V5G6_9GAMM